jgi:phosphatidylinositol-3-phosphatase
VRTRRHITICAALATVVAIAVEPAVGQPVTGTSASPGLTGAAALQRVKHVFMITLENKSYDVTFRTSTQAPYLNGTLKPMGALLTNYYGTGHASLDNYIAMISGQPASLDTQRDCPTFSDFKQTGTTGDGIATGNGCVYPASVKTLPDQLKAHGLTWKGYMEDMGNNPARESATCGHPVLNTRDPTQEAQAPSAAVPLGDQYAARHNPFVYFHSIIDSSDCAANVVALDKLEADLTSITTTPNFVFITPNLCNDAHDGDGTGTPGKGCVNGEPGGLASADKFVQTWVPKILASPAFKQDGLLIINFDESDFASVARSTDPATGKTTITATFQGEACCAQQLGPNVTRPVTEVILVSATLEYKIVAEGLGGDRTGAVLISPFIKPGTVTSTPYNHYALLKTLEEIFQVGGYLGYANQPGLAPFGTDIFNQ